MMKRLLILTILLASAIWSNALQAQTVAIVVNNNTDRSTIGIDTLLGDAIVRDLGYTVHYRDLDSVFTPTYWESTYDLCIFPGYEVAGGGAAFVNKTPMADSVAKTTNGMLVMGNDFYNEVNLGIGKKDSSENTGYLINLNRNHWITKVLQDTVIYYAASIASLYGITIPDTLHDIQVLICDKDNDHDTSGALLAVAEAGATIINTGDGRGTALGRRAFLGMYQYTGQTMDSCQWWTTFIRTVAWSIGDTLNDGVMGQVCFSGRYELDQSCVVENSSGNDSIQCHGVWDDLYVGEDHDSKHFFLKPRGIAVARKLANVYRSATVELARWKLTGQIVAWEDGTEPETWHSTWSMAPIRRYWNGGNRGGAEHSLTVPYACWTYRYADTTGGVLVSYPWTVGGAQDPDSDMVESYIDSIVITQDSVMLGRKHFLDVDTVWMNVVILDTARFQGWVGNTLSASNTGPGGEAAYYSATTSSPHNRPVLSMRFSSWSTTAPTPIVAIEHDSLVFTCVQGSSPSPNNQSNIITNGAGGALVCQSISDDVAWASLVTPDEGTPYTVTVTVDASSLAAGYYFGTVTVQCDDAENSPQTFKIALTVTEPPSAPAPATVPTYTGLRKSQ